MVDINKTTEEIGRLKQNYKKAIHQNSEKRNHEDVEKLNKIVKDVEEDAKSYS
jgi:hypothetical protein